MRNPDDIIIGKGNLDMTESNDRVRFMLAQEKGIILGDGNLDVTKSNGLLEEVRISNVAKSLSKELVDKLNHPDKIPQQEFVSGLLPPPQFKQVPPVQPDGLKH